MPFLGVHLTRMIDGSVTVGPNAVLAFKREGYRKRDFSFSDTLEILSSSGIRRVLQNHLRSGLGEIEKLAVQKRLSAAGAKVLSPAFVKRSPALARRCAGAGGIAGWQAD
ncbi:hydroxyglutarate oxidase [Escherichia coli]|uniref:Hydroxyglutarate oxidase n=1 Tax=Escherichia coli TaxID=562 RepID=A0A377AHQ9_ECOLX|nr:hydroxyglutarate oxidase [Escherichia coli]